MQAVPVNATCALVTTFGGTGASLPRIVLGTYDRVLHVLQGALAPSGEVSVPPLRTTKTAPPVRAIHTLWERNLPGQIRSISESLQDANGHNELTLLVGLSTGLLVTVDASKRVVKCVTWLFWLVIGAYVVAIAGTAPRQCDPWLLVHRLAGCSLETTPTQAGLAMCLSPAHSVGGAVLFPVSSPSPRWMGMFHFLGDRSGTRAPLARVCSARRCKLVVQGSHDVPAHRRARSVPHSQLCDQLFTIQVAHEFGLPGPGQRSKSGARCGNAKRGDAVVVCGWDGSTGFALPPHDMLSGETRARYEVGTVRFDLCAPVRAFHACSLRLPSGRICKALVYYTTGGHVTVFTGIDRAIFGCQCSTCHTLQQEALCLPSLRRGDCSTVTSRGQPSLLSVGVASLVITYSRDLCCCDGPSPPLVHRCLISPRPRRIMTSTRACGASHLRPAARKNPESRCVRCYTVVAVQVPGKYTRGCSSTLKLSMKLEFLAAGVDVEHKSYKPTQTCCGGSAEHCHHVAQTCQADVQRLRHHGAGVPGSACPSPLLLESESLSACAALRSLASGPSSCTSTMGSPFAPVPICVGPFAAFSTRARNSRPSGTFQDTSPVSACS